MGNLGGGEILVILLVALIVLGPEKLPGAARQVGNVFRQFRAMSLDFRAEFEDALNAADEPVAQSPEELAAESAARARGAELIAAENAAKADNPAASPENGQQIDQTDDPKDPTADHGGTSSIGVSEPFAAVTPAPPASKPASLAYR
ncbi:MAG: twin-arginine translocase subunit TatB, partial [Acidimicrobiales bacterium]|nr:twin-arginine translocase subunit TatB [Acidimicrobiales bacterium]